MLTEDLEMITVEADDLMDKALKHLQAEFSHIRAGRAAPSMLEGIRVESYGSMMPLNQVASVSAPSPDMIIVQPWDKGTLRDIEKAITAANLGFNPSNDGNIIRVPVPPLSEERRRDLGKAAKHKAEEAKVAIRNIRRDANNDIKKTQQELKLSEDMRFEGEESIQKMTDLHIHKIEDMLTKKEAEIMKV
jgi:ribosome recycling factor